MGWWPFGRRGRDETEDRSVEAMLEQAAGAAPPAAPAPVAPVPGDFRLTVEDVFSITGRGTVVTGQVESGSLTVGQPVQVLRNGSVVASTEVAGIEKFRAVLDTATVGEHVGLLMRGLRREELGTGDVVVG